jgi:hypothetical protein
MMPAAAIAVSFALVWLLVHGRFAAAAALALIALPAVLFALRRR